MVREGVILGHTHVGLIFGLLAQAGVGDRRLHLTRQDDDLREPLVRCQGSQVSVHVARGSASWLSSHGRGLGPPEVGVAFQAPPGSQDSSRGEAKDSALLSSRDAGLLEPLERRSLLLPGRER